MLAAGSMPLKTSTPPVDHDSEFTMLLKTIFFRALQFLNAREPRDLTAGKKISVKAVQPANASEGRAATFGIETFFKEVQPKNILADNAVQLLSTNVSK